MPSDNKGFYILSFQMTENREEIVFKIISIFFLWFFDHCVRKQTCKSTINES